MTAGATPAVPRPARVPPHDLDAEESLLGAGMLARGQLEVAVRFDTADLYKPAHRTIHQALRRLHARGQPVDPVTLAAELKGDLASVGGRKELARIQAATPSSANAESYAAIIRAHAERRRTIGLATELAERAYAGADTTNLRAQLAQTGGGSVASSLEEVDLAATLAGATDELPPGMLSRDDGVGLLYAGRANTIHSEPSLGKTWIALLAIVETLERGGCALLLDYEDTAAATIQRLLALGLDPAVVGDGARLRYINPTGALGADELAELHAITTEQGTDLLVIDAMAPALARDGIDENSNGEVTGWYERVVRPLVRNAHTVLLLDHVVKDPAARARGGRGAGAKLALLDGASYELRADRPFSKDRPGVLRLVIAKDRPGAIGPIGATAAVIHVTPSDDRLAFEIRAPEASVTDAGDFRPTILMERLSRGMEARGEPVMRDEAISLCTGKTAMVRVALQRLVTEGHVAVEADGNRKLYRSVTPFRNEPGPPVPTRSQPGPGPGSEVTRSPRSPVTNNGDRGPGTDSADDALFDADLDQPGPR